jgi:hypothetical protein
VPIASWLNNIGVAQFASRHFGVAAGVPLETWVFHQDRDAGIATFESPTRQAIEFYSHRIGPYPYEKLADVEAAGIGGGMEHASDDFRQVMEEISGADLGWFFRQWLYRAGSPVVEGGWRYNAAAKKIEIELAQTQPGDAFRLPLEVGVAKIEMTRKQQRFEIPADQEPAELSLDPNTWILMDAHFGKK